MSLEDWPLPAPPRFVGSDIRIPPFFHCSHPYTKWMLNMLRGGASFRISTMIKERPELFQQIYQIPDCPDLVRNESHDTISMFNRHTILFLNPLCLAIYMKKEKSAELILKSGLNNSNQKCWASEVFSRSQSSRGDLLEIYPICIAIRREHFEVIPCLVHCEPRNYLYGTSFSKLNITEKIEIHYENGERKKIFRYKDALQYAIDTLKRRGNLPLSRLLELLIIDCPNLFNPYRFDEDKNGNLFSLFFRIARVAYFDDPDCRICMQLMQCLEVLLKHRCVPWSSLSTEIKSSQIPFNTSFNGDKEQELISKDHSSSIGFLLALYHQIQKKVKNGPLDNLGYLIIKALRQALWIDEFIKMTPEQIQNKFGRISSDITIPLETIGFVKRHVQAIIELEKEREFKSNIFPKSKSFGFTKRFHRRSCSLVEQCEPSGVQNLLQTRGSNGNMITPEFSNTQTFIKPTKSNSELLKSEELVPLYVYQTIVNNCETQTASDSPPPNNDYLVAQEEVIQSPVFSEKCERIETAKHILMPELYKNYEIDNLDLPFEYPDPNNVLSRVKAPLVKPGYNNKFIKQDTKYKNLKRNFIPDNFKSFNGTKQEMNNLPIVDYTDMSDSNSINNCLEMTPIKPVHKIIGGSCRVPSNNHNINPENEVPVKQININSSNNSNNFKNVDHFFKHKNENFPTDYKTTFFDQLDLLDDYIISSNTEESDLSGELSDNDRLLELEEDLLDELFIEYGQLPGNCINESVMYPRDKINSIGDIPLISKRYNSKYVNYALYNMSTGNDFSKM